MHGHTPGLDSGFQRHDASQQAIFSLAMPKKLGIQVILSIILGCYTIFGCGLRGAWVWCNKKHKKSPLLPERARAGVMERIEKKRARERIALQGVEPTGWVLCATRRREKVRG
jgi:uncharacterized iron-regulated membrane protein